MMKNIFASCPECGATADTHAITSSAFCGSDCMTAHAIRKGCVYCRAHKPADAKWTVRHSSIVCPECELLEGLYNLKSQEMKVHNNKIDEQINSLMKSCPNHQKFSVEDGMLSINEYDFYATKEDLKEIIREMEAFEVSEEMVEIIKRDEEIAHLKAQKKTMEPLLEWVRKMRALNA